MSAKPLATSAISVGNFAARRCTPRRRCVPATPKVAFVAVNVLCGCASDANAAVSPSLALLPPCAVASATQEPHYYAHHSLFIVFSSPPFFKCQPLNVGQTWMFFLALQCFPRLLLCLSMPNRQWKKWFFFCIWLKFYKFFYFNYFNKKTSNF